MAGNAPMSFVDLMRGVSKVHKGLAESVPGAKRIPQEMSSKVEKMMPTEVLEEYNRRKMFGQTATGEPYRGVIRESLGEAPGTGGRLPKKGHLLVVPESKADRYAQGLEPMAGVSDMRFKRYQNMGAEPPLTAYTLGDVDQMKMAGQPKADIFDINALDIGRGMGPMQYRAMYDMINAGGDVNQASFLTDINVLRRLGNVAPLYLDDPARAVSRGVMPISESPRPAGSYSQQLFSQPISSKGGEQYALQKLFEDYDDLVDEAMTLQPRDLRGMSPDVMAGLLYSREAQLNKAYGPESQGGMMALPQHLGNKDVLFRLTEPYRSAAARTNETGVRAGIGPHTLGRARTTEEAIYRMLRQGADPDDITNDLLREMRGETGGMKGRYAKGGLACALEG
jgi:hypothetical protein